MSRDITIVTPEHVELTFELAGVGSRFIALVLDTLLTAAVFTIISLACYFIAIITPDMVRGNVSPWLFAIFTLVTFALIAGYNIYFEAVKNGQTPGKRAVGIRVIRDTGHPVDFRSALLRNLMRIVDMLPGAYTVGFITMFASPQYRRLGDMVAGTLVVKTHPKALQAFNHTQETESVDETARLPESVYPNLSAITRDDYRAVRHLLDRRSELDENIVSSLATNMAYSLAVKLNADTADIGDPILFLQGLGAEWEKRVTR